MKRIIVLLALCLLTGGASLAQAGLIRNASFEDGDILGSGGSLSPIPEWGGLETFATDDSDFPHGGFGAYSGFAYAAFGAIGGLDSIEQTIDTNPGQVYQLEYRFASDGNALNEFLVTWNGTVLFNEIDILAHDYQQYTFAVTGSAGTTGLLLFAGRDDAGYLSLDDVSLTALPATVPEPGSSTVLVIAAATLLGWQRWSRTAEHTKHRQSMG